MSAWSSRRREVPSRLLTASVRTRYSRRVWRCALALNWIADRTVRRGDIRARARRELPRARRALAREIARQQRWYEEHLAVLGELETSIGTAGTAVDGLTVAGEPDESAEALRRSIESAKAALAETAETLRRGHAGLRSHTQG